MTCPPCTAIHHDTFRRCCVWSVALFPCLGGTDPSGTPLAGSHSSGTPFTIPHRLVPGRQEAPLTGLGLTATTSRKNKLGRSPHARLLHLPVHNCRQLVLPRREHPPTSTPQPALVMSYSPSRCPVFSPYHGSASPSPTMTSRSPTPVSDLMHRLTSLCRAPVEPRPGPHAPHADPQGQLWQLPRSYPPGSWESTCRISRIHACTDISDLAILLNKDTFEPGAFPSPSPSPPRASTWRRASLVVRGMLRRPSVADSLTTTFCSSPHSQQSCQKKKKRDASTALLRRLHAHMVRLDVDFTGGDCNLCFLHCW